jgi:hypothetical protein
VLLLRHALPPAQVALQSSRVCETATGPVLCDTCFENDASDRQKLNINPIELNKCLSTFPLSFRTPLSSNPFTLAASVQPAVLVVPDTVLQASSELLIRTLTLVSLLVSVAALVAAANSVVHPRPSELALDFDSEHLITVFE